MIGHKTTCKLQKPAETADGMGGKTIAWKAVQNYFDGTYQFEMEEVK